MVEKAAHVIGAGISGLVVAYELAKAGYAVNVYEKESVPGGLAKTLRFDEYYIDFGPHLFHTSNDDIAAYWESEFPGEFRFPALFGGNFLDGVLFDYPLTKASVDQFDVVTRRKIYDEWEALVDGGQNSATSYKDYIEAIAGPTLQSMFYENYPQKLWGIPTDELSPNWAPQRIEIRDERKPFHGSQWCGVAINGCGRIAEILVEKMTRLGAVLHHNVEISGFEVEERRVKALSLGDRSIAVEEGAVVVSTVGVDVLASFLNIRTSLEFRSIKLVSFVVNGEDSLPDSYDWLYFQDPGIVFHRVGSQTRFSSAGIAPGFSIMTAEVAYSQGDEIGELSDEALISRCKRDLGKVGLGFKGDLIAEHVFDAGPVYPGYRVGYEEELKRTEGEIEAYENVFSTGSLANFSYSDVQILFAKSIDLASRLVRPDFAYNNVKKSLRRVNSFQPSFAVDDIQIGDGAPPYLIAEIGLNHNGDLGTALKLVDYAVESGFQAVKLQTFARGRASSKVEDARYKEDLFDLEENVNELFDRLVVSEEFIREVFRYASRRGVTAFSTPFDLASVDLLEELKVPMYKVSSMDLVNLPLIEKVSRTRKPLVLSTGMSSLIEIEEALDVVRSVGNENLILLHCLSSYPAPAGELNLRAIKKLSDYFSVPVGYSDHSSTNELIPAAVALGAQVIEKHVTLDRRMKGPDHNFSLELEGMKNLSRLARTAHYSMGDGVKRIMPSEMETVRSLRRSVFSAIDIEAGTVLEEEMMTVKSPGTGILPKYLPLVVGRVARRDIARDFPITWDAV